MGGKEVRHICSWYIDIFMFFKKKKGLKYNLVWEERGQTFVPSTLATYIGSVVCMCIYKPLSI